MTDKKHTELMLKDAGIGNNYEDFRRVAKRRGWKVYKKEEIYTRDIDYNRISCKVENNIIVDLEIG